MTEETMTPPRFKALAEAYGGDIYRWPAAEQDDGRALLAEQPALALVLGEAVAVDAFLSSAPTPAFSGVLRERLVASAPRRPALVGARRWLSGAGLAAACVIGVFTGAHFSDRLVGDRAADTVAQAKTSFDGASDYLSLGDAG